VVAWKRAASNDRALAKDDKCV